MATSSLPSISSVLNMADTLVNSKPSEDSREFPTRESQLELVQHKAQVHSQGKYQTFHCPVCKAMFSGQALLADHLLKSHGQLRPECFSSCHRCPSCKTEYNTLESLIQHIRGGCTNKQVNQPGQENAKPESGTIGNQIPVDAACGNKEVISVPDLYSALLNAATYGVKASLFHSKAPENQVPVQNVSHQNRIPTNQVNTALSQLTGEIPEQQQMQSKPYTERKTQKQITVAEKCLQKTWRLPKKRKNPVNPGAKYSCISRIRPAQNVTNIRQSARSGNVWDQAHRLSGNCLQLTWKLPKKAKREDFMNKKPGVSLNYLKSPTSSNRNKVYSTQQAFVPGNASVARSITVPQTAASSSPIYKNTGMLSMQEVPVKHLKAASQAGHSQGIQQGTPIVSQSEVGHTSENNFSENQGNTDVINSHIPSSWMRPDADSSGSVMCPSAVTTQRVYQQAFASALQNISNGHTGHKPLSDMKDVHQASADGVSVSSNGINRTALMHSSTGLEKDVTTERFGTHTNIQEESTHTLPSTVKTTSKLSSTHSPETSNNGNCSSVTSITCAFCDSVYDNLKSLFEHELTHEKMGTLMCKECGVCASTLVEMYKHVGPNRKCPDDEDNDDTTSQLGQSSVSDHINTPASIAGSQVPPKCGEVVLKIGCTTQNIPRNPECIDDSDTPVAPCNGIGSNCDQAIVHTLVDCNEEGEKMDEVYAAKKRHIENEGQTKNLESLNHDKDDGMCLAGGIKKSSVEIRYSQSPVANDDSEDGLHLRLDCSDTEVED